MIQEKYETGVTLKDQQGGATLRNHYYFPLVKSTLDYFSARNIAITFEGTVNNTVENISKID